MSLRRIRHGVRATLALGVAASVTANVLHAQPTAVGRAIAAWPPLALLLTIELISRVPVTGRALTWVRMAATSAIAGIAAWVSYWHMVEVAARHGESAASARLVPLSVDGLVVVASVCLVEIAGRLRAMESDAATPADLAVQVEQLDDVDKPAASALLAAAATADRPAVSPGRSTAGPRSTSGAAPRGSRRPASPVARAGEDTGAAVARLRAEEPDLSAVEIARRLGVTDRTVRRHLAAGPAETVPGAGADDGPVAGPVEADGRADRQDEQDHELAEELDEESAA